MINEGAQCQETKGVDSKGMAIIFFLNLFMGYPIKLDRIIGSKSNLQPNSLTDN